MESTVDLTEFGSSWGSYASSHALGNPAIEELLLDPVTIEEKVDGSQFSFGLIDGQIRMKTRKAELYVSPEGRVSEKMFQKAAETVLKIKDLLHPEWTYRAEYLPKPKAVTLAYDRVPKDYLIGFDVSTGEQRYLPYFDKVNEFSRLGLETVPIMFEGWVHNVQTIMDLLERTSILGGQKIEGVVIKNYVRMGRDKKILLGKYVSADFKEMHNANWKNDNPKQGDVVQAIIENLRTPARWAKAVQHLEEAGILQHTLRDIGSLFVEVPEDVRQEHEEEIKNKLFRWAWPQISRGITAGMADWYKLKLAEEQAVAADVDKSMERSMSDEPYIARGFDGIDGA